MRTPSPLGELVAFHMVYCVCTCSVYRANEVTPGSSVLVQGTLLKSNHSGQHVELAADSVELLGPCNTGVSS